MDILADPTFLSRFQFALTVAFHYIFVPLSIGLGLILAIFETRYYRDRTPENAAAAKLWLKIFTTTFAVGVATGITMEFSFGTNWADYSRFVGDIFGAPLAAEALFAFFLESVFLGVLLFGSKKVSPKFYLVSAWLVWAGSLLSALWILIANSWMQTPTGAVLSPDGSKANITNFFQAAFNPSILDRYTHTVDALILMGAFGAIAIGAYYLLKGKHEKFAMRTVRTGAVVGVIAACLMLVFAHATATGVAQNQPTKFAMMEGQYQEETSPLYLLGFVDETNQKVVAPFAIEGGTSFLASGNFDTVYPGMNELSQTSKYGEFDPATAPVGVVFSSYHCMVFMFLLMALALLAVLITAFGKKRTIGNKKWLQRILVISPLFPFIAIQTGWITAEVGRQPWVVYPSTQSPDGISLLTSNGISLSVSAPELLITIALFFIVYIFLFVAWWRLVSGYIKTGPVPEEATATAAAGDAAGAADTKEVAETAADAADDGKEAK